AERILARLKAEAEALTRVLGPAAVASGESPSLLAELQVPPGFEAATAALFDGELVAPLVSSADQGEAGAGAGWVVLPPLTAAAHALAGEIGAPTALARRLVYAGWVDSAGEGWRLQPQLAAGQSLVDRDGRLWRWDGYTRGTAGSAATAERLRQRNRLVELAE